MMTRRNLIAVFSIVAGLCCGVSAPAARAGDAKELLKLVPKDAWGFVLAKSLDNFDAKAGKLKDALGLPIPETMTTVGLLAQLGIGETVDPKSALCLVVMDVTKSGSPQNAIVLLIGAKDPEAMLKSLSAEEAQEGVRKCKVKEEPAFAAVKGKVVVIGPDQACVAKVAKTEKSVGEDFAEARAGLLAKSDVYVSISLGTIVNAYKDQYMPLIQMMMAATDPTGKQAQQIVKMLAEMAALDIALALGDGGVDLSLMINPKSGSDLEKWYGDTKNSSDAILGLLPKEKFLFSWGGMTTDSEHAAKFGDQNMLSQMMKMAPHEGIDEKSVKTLEEQLKKLGKSLERFAMSTCALPEGSDGMFGATVVAETKDSKEFVEAIRKVYKTVWSVSEDEEFTKLKEGFVHAPDAETVAGKKVDTITVDLKKLTEEKAKGYASWCQKLLGKEAVLRFGAADDKHVVFALGGGKGRYEKACGAARSSGDNLSTDSGISDVSSQLPKPRAAEAFIAVDTIIQSFKAGQKAVGEEEFPVELPTINAPMALSLAKQGNAVRVDFVVPMKLMKAGKEAYDKFASTRKEDNFDEDEDGGKAKGAKAKKDAASGDKAKKKPAKKDTDEDADEDKDAGKKEKKGEKAEDKDKDE